jgi:hypothetical protein
LREKGSLCGGDRREVFSKIEIEVRKAAAILGGCSSGSRSRRSDGGINDVLEVAGDIRIELIV